MRAMATKPSREWSMEHGTGGESWEEGAASESGRRGGENWTDIEGLPQTLQGESREASML